MKPATVALGTLGLAALGMFGWLRIPARVVLPVYSEPVKFFSEEHQSLLVANVARGTSGLSAQACANCHPKEHQEWKGSAHSRSVTEPVFAAAFKAEQRTLCRSCHSPLQEQHPQLVDQIRQKPEVRLNGRLAPPRPQMTVSGIHSGMPDMPSTGFIYERNPQYSASLASEGVTCVTCHVREGTVLTSHPTGLSNVPHALSYSPELAKPEFCAGCHQFDIRSPRSHPVETQFTLDPKAMRLAVRQSAQFQRPNARRSFRMGGLMAQQTVNVDGDEPPVPTPPDIEDEYLNPEEPRVQNTLSEFQASPAAKRGETCQSCHMPRSEARGLHTWTGRGSVAMLQKAVDLDVALDRTDYRPGDTVEGQIHVSNQAGHAFPTGDSLHAGVLDVWIQSGKRTLSRQLYLMSTGRNTGVVVLRGERLRVLDPLPKITREARVRSQGMSQGMSQVNSLLPLADTRLQAGERLTLGLRKLLPKDLAATDDLRVRVRLFHSGVHPGLRGSRIDSHSNTLTLVREQVVPIHLAPTAAARATVKPGGHASS